MRNSDGFGVVSLAVAGFLGWLGWSIIDEAGVFLERQEYGWLLGFLVAGFVGGFLLVTSISIMWSVVGGWISDMKKRRAGSERSKTHHQ